MILNLLNENVHPGAIPLIFAVGLLLTLFCRKNDPLSHFPLINGRRPGEWLYTQSKLRFLTGARSLLQEGLQKSKGAFRLMGSNGCILILHPRYRHELRDHKHLNHTKPAEEAFFGDLVGFEPFNHSKTNPKVFAAMVRRRLTPAIGAVCRPLSEETSAVLHEQLGDRSEWCQINVRQLCLEIVARLSSRIFLGPHICRDRAWTNITINYTVNAFLAAERLRPYPRTLLRLVQWLLPQCRQLQVQVEEAQSLISRYLDEREADRRGALGKTKLIGDDDLNTVQWLEECAKGGYYDPALLQIGLAAVAIHTSADLLSQTLFDLGEHAGLIPELRAEIVDVIRTHGWNKTAMSQLKLMDSVLKESQRRKPMQIVSLHRYVTDDITLSDGTFIPKGTFLAVADEQSLDPTAIYPDGDRYDGHRFLRLREDPAQEVHAQLVSVTPQQTGFGFGNHACPGRFFAATELKIALCHLILKYDIQLIGKAPQVMAFGLGLNADPFANMRVRRRQEELALDETHLDRQ